MLILSRYVCVDADLVFYSKQTKGLLNQTVNHVYVLYSLLNQEFFPLGTQFGHLSPPVSFLALPHQRIFPFHYLN